MVVSTTQTLLWVMPKHKGITNGQNEDQLESMLFATQDRKCMEFLFRFNQKPKMPRLYVCWNRNTIVKPKVRSFSPAHMRLGIGIAHDKGEVFSPNSTHSAARLIVVDRAFTRRRLDETFLGLQLTGHPLEAELGFIAKQVELAKMWSRYRLSLITNYLKNLMSTLIIRTLRKSTNI